MYKFYAKAVLILLLLSGLIAGLWKFADYCGDAREAEVRLEYTQKESQRDKEILRLQAEIANQKKAVEDQINAERKTWEDRISKIKRIPSDCVNPDILTQLRDSGVYTGPIPCK